MNMLLLVRILVAWHTHHLQSLGSLLVVIHAQESLKLIVVNAIMYHFKHLISDSMSWRLDPGVSELSNQDRYQLSNG
jgi:hypothetical protein